MHVSVGLEWRREEQLRASTGMKSWREAEAAAIGVVRPALIHHTRVVSTASLCGDPVEKPAPTIQTIPFHPVHSAGLWDKIWVRDVAYPL